MKPHWLPQLLVIGVLLQGVTAVGADLPWDLPWNGATQDHCMGNGPAPQDGDCCAGDGAMSAACAAHCFATEAPSALILPVRPAESGALVRISDDARPSPSYIPSLPPPIS
jgi:hypothetical protein